MIWTTLGTLVLVIVATFGAFAYYYLSKQVEEESPLKSLIWWVGRLALGAVAILAVITFAMGLFSWGDSLIVSTKRSQARCESISGAVYAEGACYKDGIELKWKEDGDVQES